MTNTSGTALETISESGHVPESRATDPAQVQQAVEKLIYKDNQRSFKRARLNGLVDGNPPFSKSKLKSLGRADATNANWGTARAYMESSSGMFYDLFSEAPGHFNVRTAYGTPEQKEEWSRTMSEEADRVFASGRCPPYQEKGKVSKQTAKNPWDYNFQISIWDMTLHGCGPFMFEDEFQVLPKAFLCDDLKVPEFTKSDTSYYDQAAVLGTYYPPQLYDFIRNEEAASARGWSVEYTKKFIANAMDLRVAQSQSNMWVFYQQELKNNAMAYYDDTKVCRVAHVFWKEFDGRVTHVIVPVTSGTGQKIEFLFKSVGRYASFNECIHPMYWDHGNGGYHHSVTGLGVKMYKAMWEQNNMLCNLMDKAKAPKILFKPTTTESSQKFSLVTFGDYGVLPANFEWQQTGVAGLMNDGLAMNREITELMQSNLSTYRQPMMKQEGNPPTARQVSLEASQQSSLSKTQFNRYYEQCDSLLGEIFRRLCIKDSPDELAQEFQRKCKDRGIPRQALEKLESVTTVRVIGQGSAFMRRQSLNSLWITLAPSLPEDGRQNLQDDMIAAEAGQTAVIRYNPRKTRTTLPSDQEAEAMQWVGVAKTGVQPTITATQNPVIYAQVWLMAAAQALQSLPEGANPLEVLAFLEVIGPAIKAQLTRFAQDKSRESVFKQMEEQWRQLAQATDMLKQEIHNQQKAKAEQQQQTMQALSDEQLKQMKVQSDIQRKDLTTAARLRQNEGKFIQKMTQEEQSHAQRLALDDASTAAEISLKQAKASATNGE